MLWLTGPANPNEAPDVSVCARGLALIQALTATGEPERLVVVTHGAVAATPGDRLDGVALAPLWGLARVAMSEHPGLGCTLVDLPPSPEAADWAALITQCLQDGAEREVAVRGGQRYVNRLHTLAPAEREERRLREQPDSHHARIHLLPSPAGPGGGLVWQQGERRAPGTGEIEIRIHAVALQPQDLATATRPATASDAATESPFGHEAVGEVETTSQLAALVLAEARSGGGCDGLRTALLALPRHQRRRHLEALIAKAVAPVLGLTADQLGIHQSITSHGLDSLLALEVVLALKTSFDTEFSAVHLFTGLSVSDLAVEILARTGIQEAVA